MTEIKQLSRVVGIAGLATMVLLFVPLIAASEQEPRFTGSAAEIVTFFQSVNTPLVEVGTFVSTVGLLAFLWFMVGLSTILRTTEGTLAWRSSIAAASGVLFVALTLAGYWEAASFRADDIDPQVARFAFDVGNVSFANGWLALGSFAVGAGLVMRSSDLFRPWLGWLAIASGGGLVLSRAVWTNEIWLLPYALFWVWVIVVSVLLLRARALNQNTSQLVGRNP